MAVDKDHFSLLMNVNCDMGNFFYHCRITLIENSMPMYLVDWTQANALMIATALVLIGIPVVVLLVVFTRKSKKNQESEKTEEA